MLFKNRYLFVFVDHSIFPHIGFHFIHVDINSFIVLMNASCAFQHFCDLYGPQILLCRDTKAYVQDSNDNDDEDLKTFYS